MTATVAPLVFVPGLGFRPGDGLTLRTPITYKNGEWSISIDSVLTDRESTRVAVTIYGPFKMQSERRGPEIDYSGFITVRDRSGAQVSSERARMFPLSHSFSGLGPSISCTANLDALPDANPDLDILVGEPLPVTVIPVRLSPLAEFAIPARSLEVTDEHHGVAITAHAIARSTDMTAVLLHATLRTHPRQRFMRALGVLRDDHRGAPGVIVEDDTGTRVAAFAATRELSPGPELRMVAVLPGISAEARSATVEIPYVVLSEYTGAPVRLSVPFEGEIALGDDSAFVKVARQKGPRGSETVGVEFNGAWHDDRRLLYAESITVGEKYGGVGFRELPAEPPIRTYADDPTGDARSIALESPVLQLRGPWRLRAMLP